VNGPVTSLDSELQAHSATSDSQALTRPLYQSGSANGGAGFAIR
jgi:hypothetical protein